MVGWLRNALDFPVRQALRLRRRGCRLPAEPKDGLFPGEALAEVKRLVETYGLQNWERHSGRTDFAASLFYLQMLEKGFAEAGVRTPGHVEALDAGCGDWFYVQALYGLLRRGGRTVSLDGAELDAYQPYAGFRARIDWAEAYAAGLDGAHYIHADLRDYGRPVDIAFMLFPFLFAPDLQRWGLPRRYLRPVKLLEHVYGLVKPQGWLVIANLGAEERAEQHRLLDELSIPVVWWGRHESPLYSYRQERYLTIIKKV